MEPVLRWPGAKWRIAPWIVSMFPRHEVYCEEKVKGAKLWD